MEKRLYFAEEQENRWRFDSILLFSVSHLGLCLYIFGWLFSALVSH